ncbi:MAG TPA: hypothetical protein VF641_10250, partial [Methylobacterium sp.]
EAAELLDSPAMQAVLARLRERFDVIVMDGSCLSQSSERYAASTHADRIVFVVEWGRTERADAQASLRALAGASAKVVGVVFNKVDTSRYVLHDDQG